MNATDIVGYTSPNGFAICPDCTYHLTDPSTLHPIFADEEWDYQPTCDHCNKPLNVSLIVEEPKPC